MLRFLYSISLIIVYIPYTIAIFLRIFLNKEDKSKFKENIAKLNRYQISALPSTGNSGRGMGEKFSRPDALFQLEPVEESAALRTHTHPVVSLGLLLELGRQLDETSITDTVVHGCDGTPEL